MNENLQSLKGKKEEEMIKKYRTEIAFAVMEMILWGISSMFIVTASFTYTAPREITSKIVMATPADEYWYHIFYSTAIIYMLLGAGVGIYLARYYQNQPDKDKNTPAQVVKRGPYVRIRSWATLNTAHIGIVIAATINLFTVTGIFPYLQNNLLVLTNQWFRIAVAVIIIFIMGDMPVFLAVALSQDKRK